MTPKNIKCPQCGNQTTTYLDKETGYRYIVVCGHCGLKTPLKALSLYKKDTHANTQPIRLPQY